MTSRVTKISIFVAALAATAAVDIWPAVAMGATVASSFGVTEFDAATGEANDLTVSSSAGMIEFKDVNAALTAGTGCSQVDPHTARCPTTTSDMLIFLADKADRATIVGDLGSVLVMAGNGADTLVGGAGGEGLFGDDGSDTLHGGAGRDRLSGGSGDVVSGDSPHAHNTVFGDAGNDNLRGTVRGTSTLNGGPGNDIMINGGASHDHFLGGTGIDTVSYFVSFTSDMDHPDRTSHVVILDGIANDGHTGERDNVDVDVEDLIGGRGADEFRGNGANNLLLGKAGKDLLRAAGGNDIVRGGLGLDRLQGGSDADTLIGGLSADLLRGGSGSDRLFGGPGFDRLFGGPGADSCNLDGGGGTANC
jgi:Ca2+-binding RTX toxin-like protein